MWYGLLVNGELYHVLWMSGPPSLFDFNVSLNSQTKYEIVRVEIRVLGPA